MKDRIITVVLFAIIVLNLVDVFEDIEEGASMLHLMEEGVVLFISAVGFFYLINDMRMRTRELSQIAARLRQKDTQLSNITEEMKLARKDYSEVIHHQFMEWQLTNSEREVAMLLLKGLSFKEIAAVRDTREKTVRQQASNIYGKAEVEGRHEFSAWFLEDFIADPN